MKYTFKYALPSYDEFTGDEVGIARTVTHEFSTETLDEMLENFEMFLRGVGFVFEGDIRVVKDTPQDFEDGITVTLGSEFGDSMNIDLPGGQPTLNIDNSFLYGNDIIWLEKEDEKTFKS